VADKDTLYFGLVDFKPTTLLFKGSAGAMAKFAGFLREFAGSDVGTVDFGDIPWTHAGHHTHVTVCKASRKDKLGMRKADTKSAATFNWYLNRDSAELFAELVDVLAASDTPGHQYLDSVNGNLVKYSAQDDVEVRVSMGEYDDFTDAVIANSRPES
jgi:hypothetical protein